MWTGQCHRDIDDIRWHMACLLFKLRRKMQLPCQSVLQNKSWKHKPYPMYCTVRHTGMQEVKPNAYSFQHTRSKE